MGKALPLGVYLRTRSRGWKCEVLKGWAGHRYLRVVQPSFSSVERGDSRCTFAGDWGLLKSLQG